VDIPGDAGVEGTGGNTLKLSNILFLCLQQPGPRSRACPAMHLRLVPGTIRMTQRVNGKMIRSERIPFLREKLLSIGAGTAKLSTRVGSLNSPFAHTLSKLRDLLSILSILA
jgi:hypothetical protein